MQGSRTGLSARIAVWLVLAAGFAAMLWQNFPGHMSVDSVIELHEGRFHMRENWGPAIFPWLLGIFDRIWPGTGLYLIVSALLLFGGWAALPQLRRRGSWWLVPVAAAAVVTPNVLIYEGTVWHDVLFANAAVAGFLCLAFAARDWDASSRRPWLRLGAAVVLLSVAGLVRQNGIVVVPMGALAVGWMARGAGLRRAAGWCLGWLAAAAATTAVLSLAALPQGPGLEHAHGQGFRALAFYDLTGLAKQDPNIPLPRIEAEAPASAQAIRAVSAKYWSPTRMDFVAEAPELRPLAQVSTAALVGDWKDLILHRPDLYWPMRVEVFRWVLATPVIDSCLPVYLGIDGPAKLMKDLGLTRIWGHREDRLFNYATWFYDTPAMSHVAWAAVALALAGFLAWRREPADGPIAAMLAAALVFAASFFPISLACDYRYLIFVDLAAITGLLYVAADPRLRRAA